MSVRAECFGQSRPQEGRQQTQNQDAFVIGRQPVPWMALCDGAGNAQSVGRRALGLLETWTREAKSEDFLRDETWLRWAKRLDSALLNGPEGTFVAAAAIGDQVIGVAAGDSRAYLTPMDGPARLERRLALSERRRGRFHHHLGPGQRVQDRRYRGR